MEQPLDVQQCLQSAKNEPAIPILEPHEVFRKVMKAKKPYSVIHGDIPRRFLAPKLAGPPSESVFRQNSSSVKGNLPFQTYSSLPSSRFWWGFFLLLPHSAPSWILSLAENTACSILQDGAMEWHHSYQGCVTDPPTQHIGCTTDSPFQQLMFEIFAVSPLKNMNIWSNFHVRCPLLLSSCSEVLCCPQ